MHKKSSIPSAQKIFCEIYDKGLWGKSDNPQQLYFSGVGSPDANITTTYLNGVEKFLKSLQFTPDVVDLGCGDFSIGSRIRNLCDNYIACDIVPQLIDYNKRRYKDQNVDFRILDMITDPLPTSEVVFIRQVLQHLSNEQIQKLIPKLYSSYKYLLLTEHIPKAGSFIPNIDKPASANIRLDNNSGVVLTREPFNLQTSYERVICEVEGYGGLIQTILYKLN